MCDISQAYHPLLCKAPKPSVITTTPNDNIFRHTWYSYEAEKDYDGHRPSRALNSISPSVISSSLTHPIVNRTVTKSVVQKNKRRTPHTDESEIFIGFLFNDWSVRDLLIMIIVLQFFLLITLALK